MCVLGLTSTSMCPTLQVFDVLRSMSDFQSFKEMMLAHKAQQCRGKLLQAVVAGAGNLSLSASRAGKLVGCTKVCTHTEQHDSEEAPHLDLCLSVLPITMSPALHAPERSGTRTLG